MRNAVSIITLGCKVNQRESEILAREFEAFGFEATDTPETADAVIVNSCTVTQVSDQKTRQMARRAKRQNPAALVFVIGCYPQVAADGLLRMPEVDGIVSQADKARTAEIVAAALREQENRGRRIFSDMPNNDADREIGKSTRTRALLKIEDGCDRNCAYCVIPLARGAVRSRPEAEILAEAESLLLEGYGEIVLTGVNLALYGTELREPDRFYALLSRLSALPADGEVRFRLGSLEPTVITAEVAAAIARLPRICPHFHLSLQSGAARTLTAMGRPYTPADFQGILKTLRSIDPLFGVTTDVIAGFPGETEADFERSLRFVEKAEFLHTHIFPYSVRPGTRAAEMPDLVPKAVKTDRVKRMTEAAKISRETFLKRCEGAVRRTLLFPSANPGGAARGITDNGIDVRVTKPAESPRRPYGSFIDFQL
ncbi:MAG: tRNA (N(6)-L-threonylcarbamoyladenosine(37)-C(2))-methylthiotransferase MtaB [Clostridiales bacterium]|nr:tRNA (N(6)-L-threonylcarbamoyladenosine(37)-C(2))-methylthiotransferase MtaB [Clostridiales bacterium]